MNFCLSILLRFAFKVFKKCLFSQNVLLESGENHARWSACAGMEPLVTHSMASVCAPGDGLVAIAIRSVLQIDMAKIVAKSVAADTVAAVITFPGSVTVLLATLDLCK